MSASKQAPALDVHELPDVQKLIDERGIELQKVGVSQVKHPIQHIDKNGREQQALAVFTLAIKLSPTKRGAHMSRFIESLNDFKIANPGTISKLAKDLQQRLDSKQSFVKCRFELTRRRLAPISRAIGYAPYHVGYHCESSEAKSNISLEVRTEVKTLCPCSKEISEKNAHSQRCNVTLRLLLQNNLPKSNTKEITDNTLEAPHFEDLLAIIESSASSPLYPTVKRADEKFITESAYAKPVFVEDLSREILRKCASFTCTARANLHVESKESIHHHNAFVQSSAQTAIFKK